MTLNYPTVAKLCTPLKLTKRLTMRCTLHEKRI
jgi:hypothetical protein